MIIQCNSKAVYNAIQYLGDNADEVIEFTYGEAEKQPVYSSLLFRKIKIEIDNYVVNDTGVLIVLPPNRFESMYQQIKK